MNTVAIIPARGGSKRIPHKNIIDFLGKPMIAWTIESAQKSNLFEDIVVSTDDAEIASVAKKYGAAVPFMREKYADDITPISEATAEALVQLHAQGKQYTHVVQLMANCPLRTEHDICDAYQHFIDNKATAQISVTSYGFLNPWWAMKMQSDGHGEKIFPDALKQRSQDLEKLYCPTGAIWVANTSALLEHRTFYTPDHSIHPMAHWHAALDIDDYNDLNLAQAVATMQASATV